MSCSYTSLIEAFREGEIGSPANKTFTYFEKHPEVMQAIEKVLTKHGVRDFEMAFTSAGSSVTWRTSRDQIVRAVIRSEEPQALEAATILQPVKDGTFHVGDVRVEILPFNNDVIGFCQRTGEESRYVDTETQRITKLMQQHGYDTIDMHPMSVNNAFLPDGTIIAVDRGAADIPPGTTPAPITAAPWVKEDGTLRQWDFY